MDNNNFGAPNFAPTENSGSLPMEGGDALNVNNTELIASQESAAPAMPVDGAAPIAPVTNPVPATNAQGGSQKKGSSIVLILLVVLFALAAGVFAFLYFTKDTSDKSLDGNSSSVVESTNADEEEESDDTADSSSVKEKSPATNDTEDDDEIDSKSSSSANESSDKEESSDAGTDVTELLMAIRGNVTSHWQSASMKEKKAIVENGKLSARFETIVKNTGEKYGYTVKYGGKGTSANLKAIPGKKEVKLYDYAICSSDFKEVTPSDEALNVAIVAQDADGALTCRGAQYE